MAVKLVPCTKRFARIVAVPLTVTLLPSVAAVMAPVASTSMRRESVPPLRVMALGLVVDPSGPPVPLILPPVTLLPLAWSTPALTVMVPLMVFEMLPAETVLAVAPVAPPRIVAPVAVPDLVRPLEPAMMELRMKLPEVLNWLMIRSLPEPACRVPPVMISLLVTTVVVMRIPPVVMVLLPESETVSTAALLKRKVLVVTLL